MVPPLVLTHDGDVATLNLARPPANVLDPTFFEHLARLVRDVLPGLPVTGLVVTGQGRHFSSGSDVAALLQALQPDEPPPPWCEAHRATFQALGRLPYPTVAAIAGCCLGSGLELALACTARVAANNAVFSLPEAQHDLLPGCGGTVHLAALAGWRTALRLILTGEMLDAFTALDLGLVDRVVPRADLPSEALRVLRVLPRPPPPSPDPGLPCASSW